MGHEGTGVKRWRREETKKSRTEGMAGSLKEGAQHAATTGAQRTCQRQLENSAAPGLTHPTNSGQPGNGLIAGEDISEKCHHCRTLVVL